jgi:hypothetical protein
VIQIGGIPHYYSLNRHSENFGRVPKFSSCNVIINILETYLQLEIKKMLEILIPTYNRPEAATQAIHSCLDISDSRLTVRCNSNGYELSMEKFRSFNKQLTYDCFEKNQGANANILHLLNSTTSNFVMLLSDEDCLDARGAKQMLDFLDKLPKTVKVVSCSIFDQTKGNYYSLTPASEHYSFSLNTYLMTGMPVPSYMSGLIFSTDALRDLNLEKLFAPSMGNAYPHLGMVMQLLERGQLRFYNKKFVVKGSAVFFGGDAFSHRLTKNSAASDNLDLNPFVYGPRARARQYFYQDQMITNLINANKLSKIISKIYTFIGFYKDIKNSGNVIILNEGCDIRQEVISAKEESIANNEWSGSVFSIFFVHFIRLSWPISIFICRLLVFSLRIYNKFLWHFLRIR